MTIKEIAEKVLVARQNIEGDILTTPLIRSHILSNLIDGHVYLKLESEQYTGSFKARGSLNKLRSLNTEDKNRELVTASTGNHGLGFARAVQLTGARGTVYLPSSASKAKIKRLGYYPVTLKFHDGDSLSTELIAKKIAAQTEAIWISPYNDYDVIAGQGTIAIELLDQLPHFDNVFITVGGGGLISGIGSYLKSETSQVKIIACQPANSPEMTHSLEAGKIVQMKKSLPTLSDGSAGGIEPNAITFSLCQKIIDHSILVSENEIRSALRLMVYEHGKIIEGSAAVTIASLLREKEKFKNKTVILIICGGNIDIKKLKEII